MMKIEISLDTKDAADLAALMALVQSQRPLTGGEMVVESIRQAVDFIPEEILGRLNSVAVTEFEPDGTKGPPLTTPGLVDADKYAYAEDDDTPAMPNPEGAPDVDSRGLPWDERIHASTKATNGDGSWRNKRGVDKALLEAVEAELAGGAVLNVPEPAATASGADVAAGASEIPLPPAPAAEEAAGIIPDAPAAPTPADAPTFKDAMAIVTTRQREGTLTQVQVSEAAQALGLSSVVDLAKPANAEHIAAFIALLG